MLENRTFVRDPFDFAKKAAINLTDFRPLGKWADIPGKMALLTQLDQQGWGYFNITRSGLVELDYRFSGGDTHPGGHIMDPLIEGYWVPYVNIGMQGTGIANVPYVDVPLAAPPKSFVFTGSMNGCSLVVTDTPGDATKIRIHHDSAHGANTFNGMTVRARLDYGNTHGSPHRYGDTTPHATDVATSCNFFHHDGTNWNLVCQPQLFIPGGNPPRVKLNASKAPFTVVV